MILVSRLDEVMVPNVGHDFGARQDFDMELIFDFVKLLDMVLALWSAGLKDSAYPSTMGDIHGCGSLVSLLRFSRAGRM